MVSLKIETLDEKEAEKRGVNNWGIWEKEPSEFDWAYTQTETCLILDGEVTVSDKDNSVSFEQGDLVIFPVDLECTWQIKKPVRKHYNFS